MKINSHLLGFLIVGGFVATYFWFVDKQVERVGDYTIFKRRNVFVAERITGDKEKNPTFGTIEEVRAWIAQQQVLDKVKAAEYSLPWGHS